MCSNRLHSATSTTSCACCLHNQCLYSLLCHTKTSCLQSLPFHSPVNNILQCFIPVVSSTTAEKTIEVLRHLFTAHGLHEQLVSDSDPQFVSEEFATFNGIHHICTAPYNPSSNGLAHQTFRSVIQTSTQSKQE